MSQWPFVIAAYAIGLGGTAGLIAWAAATLHRAEAASEEQR